MGKYLDQLKQRESKVSENSENHTSLNGCARRKLGKYGSTNPQNPQNPCVSHGNAFAPTLKPGVARPPWRERNREEWQAALDRQQPAGAALICSALQAFEPLFSLARANRLPLGPVRVEIGGEVFVEPDATGLLLLMELEWTARAKACNRAARLLTPEEEVALDCAREFLEWLSAARGESQWLDLRGVELK